MSPKVSLHAHEYCGTYNFIDTIVQVGALILPHCIYPYHKDCTSNSVHISLISWEEKVLECFIFIFLSSFIQFII